MNNVTNRFVNISLSLSDILTEAYTDSLCRAKAVIEDKPESYYKAIANEKIEFYPEAFQQKLLNMIPKIGTKILEVPLENTADGAATTSFNSAFSANQSPLIGKGYFKITEDGTLQAITKSEHYHAPLGHDFPGYQLLENAKKLGISNVTHNNTRGFITRLLEQELVRIANGLYGTDANLEEIVANAPEQAMTKVINLQTGSLAVEAGMKMMLARFYVSDPGMGIEPEYKDRIPVFIVMADYTGGKQANYHGTTVLTQTMRDLWPGLYQKFEQAEAYKVVATPINDIDAFRAIVKSYDTGKYKIAGFFHELILMNYGGITLHKDFLQKAHEICHTHDIPTLVDEIQSCLWAPDHFLYKEYGLHPDFVSVGKGFPGGQYASSKILLTEKMDNLNQFGALVTNGQEELASLAYLITIIFSHENREITKQIGEYYEAELKKLAAKYSAVINKIEGLRHLSALVFKSAETAAEFAATIRSRGYDISAQTYKANCPPAALTKIPLIADKELVDAFITCMDDVLKSY